MTAEWTRMLLDLVLIGMIGLGVAQAARLIRHLVTLRQSRAEMERFVHDFNATVTRAEQGIKGLRQAARESGDDLEKLVEKAVLVRDELHFIVESADKIAERLSHSASHVLQPEEKPAAKAAAPQAETSPAHPQPQVAPFVKKPEAREPSSRAEKELLQALRKLS